MPNIGFLSLNIKLEAKRNVPSPPIDSTKSAHVKSVWSKLVLKKNTIYFYFVINI